jgi:type II secretory pathway pseudopilin PulG
MLALMAGLLVVAGSIAAVLVMQQQRKDFWEPHTETDTDLRDIEAALIAYQRSPAHRLPCPASFTADTGAEVANCDSLTPADIASAGMRDGGDVLIGAVPTKILGLPDTAGEDQWGNKLTYVVTKTYTNSFTFATPVTAGATVNTETNQGYVILSHGADGKGAYTAKKGIVGKACASTSGEGADLVNCDADATFKAAGMNTTPGEDFFDDIVTYGPVDTTAQNTNRPCPNGMATSWSGGGAILGTTGSCSGAVLNEAGGGLRSGASTAAAITTSRTRCQGDAKPSPVGSYIR